MSTDNFIVSARKYRPDTFDTVVGQQGITTTLKNAISNAHIAQSFLFCGPRGVGKTTCARILAKTINCMNLSPNIEACGKCESCKGFQENASQNIYELDAASNRSIESMRNLVEQVRIPPQIGKYKVYIIDEVHMLTTEAFNAFLKTLEEPPAYVKFILATTERHKILPTILSRCQIFDFQRISNDDIVQHLFTISEKESITAEEEALRIIAQKADGGLRDALSMFDQIVSFSGNSITYEQVINMLNILDCEYYFKLCDAFVLGDIASALNLFNTVLEKGFEGKNFVMGLGQHLRSLMVLQDKETITLLECSQTLKQRFLVQSEKFNIIKLLRALELCNACDLDYRSSNNKRLLVEILLLQLCELFSEGGRFTQPLSETPPPSETLPLSETPPLSETLIGVNTSNIGATAIKRASISLKATKNKIQSEHEAQKEIIAKKEQANVDFTSEALDLVWREYAESLKPLSPALYDVISNSKVSKGEDFIINITLVNEFQNTLFADSKKSGLDFLRLNLSNSGLQFHVNIDENIAPKKIIYSATDKYAALVEHNPLLKEFKANLNLDIEL